MIGCLSQVFLLRFTDSSFYCPLVSSESHGGQMKRTRKVGRPSVETSRSSVRWEAAQLQRHLKVRSRNLKVIRRVNRQPVKLLENWEDVCGEEEALEKLWRTSGQVFSWGKVPQAPLETVAADSWALAGSVCYQGWSLSGHSLQQEHRSIGGRGDVINTGYGWGVARQQRGYCGAEGLLEERQDVHFSLKVVFLFWNEKSETVSSGMFVFRFRIHEYDKYRGKVKLNNCFHPTVNT